MDCTVLFLARISAVFRCLTEVFCARNIAWRARRKGRLGARSGFQRCDAAKGESGTAARSMSQLGVREIGLTMDFIDQIRQIAARIPKQLEFIKTEEATKNALIMPFINALGYNVFDPTEVVPEFTADVGLKKGEKVDYAILKDGKPIMLFECKSAGTNLDLEHFSQLLRYFHTSAARIGVLTNGVTYRFFTDLDNPNVMDTKPFLELDMLDIKEAAVQEVKRFSRSTFNSDELSAAATQLRYTKEIKQVIADQFSKPSEELVALLVGRVYAGKKTKAVMERFADIAQRALNQFVTDAINDRLRQALGDGAAVPQIATAVPAAVSEIVAAPEKDDGIVTTPDEVEAFHIVKALLRESVEPKRIVMRDAKSYCSVLLDDNNRKPVCRFRFSDTKKVVVLFDEQKQETAYPIADLHELYGLADRLKATASAYSK